MNAVALWSLGAMLAGAVGVGGNAAIANRGLEVRRGWFDDGSLAWERTYREGREHGLHRGWYPSGGKRFEIRYVDGFAEGEAREWYPSGKLLTEFRYVRGHEMGRQRMWTEDGILRANYVVRDGRRYGLIGSVGCTGHASTGEKTP
jgi:antitoxin component YwqK of YwqJK toxin-antitoxin module